MLREKHDINSSELYTPRPNPRVKKAAPYFPISDEENDLGLALRSEYALAPQSEMREAADDFVYDEDPHWTRSIAEIEMTKSYAKQHERPRAPATIASFEKPSKASKAPKQKELHNGKGTPSAKRKGKGKREGKGHPFLYLSIIVGCVLAMSVIVVMMMPQLAGYFWVDLDNYAFINGELLRYDAKVVDTYKQYREYMRQDVIYPGVFLDGTHIGGMTTDEAEQAFSSVVADTGSMYSVVVAIGNKTWTIDETNVPATRTLGNVIQRAYAIGRTNTTAILGTKQTPFRERVTTVMGLREEGVNLTTMAEFDEAALRSLVGEITQFVTREAKDAQIQSFDYATRSFTFSEEQVGVTIDDEALYQKIAASLNRREHGTTLSMEPVVSQPTVTKAQLAKNFKMIAAYTTDTTSDTRRNNNISLASQAINGTALLPGDTFSFNKATGQRTVDKGYQEAGAISGGQSIEEVGGGICQVSSTLFNAVARANLEIVSRSPHAWPSTYVNRGEDATVNWPNLDFQFKNNTTSPIFVITYYKDRKCSAEIWGISLGEGITIDLKSEIVKTIEPSTEVKYVNNVNLPYGTSKETIKARTGYVVDTYQVWYQDGKETKREKMHTSTYKAYQRTVEYN